MIVGWRATGRGDLPRHLEIGARVVVGGGCDAALFVRVGSRIKAAQSLPGSQFVWQANTVRDRANVNVAEIDVPQSWRSGYRRRVRAGMP